MTLSSVATSPSQQVRPWAIALAGMVSLATAVGIGRFAFTPLLPLMLHEGVIDLHTASWLASANYLGYLVGALLCTFQPWIWQRFKGLPPMGALIWVRAGLAATSLVTLGMVLHIPALWPMLRFAAGVASAFVFIFTSGWCLAQLAKQQASALGGVLYAGPGVGITFSGFLASGMVALHLTASVGWLIFGLLACVLSALVWQSFKPQALKEAITPLASSSALKENTALRVHRVHIPASRKQMLLLALAYGLAGFGYIITATFLPVIARQVMPGSAWLDMFWPLFGISIVAGSLLATRISLGGDLRYLLAGCYFVQALGVVVPVWSPTLVGFVAGSFGLGLPFAAISFFAMQEVRRLLPLNAASYMGLLTAVYGTGQVLGPPVAAVLLVRSQSPGAGFTLSLEIAAAALVLGAVLYLWMVRAYPMYRSPSQLPAL